MKSTLLLGACAALLLSAVAASAQTVPAAPAKPTEATKPANQNDAVAGSLPASAAAALAAETPDDSANLPPSAEAAMTPAAHVAAIPAAKADVVEVLRAQGQFATLLKALDAANLTTRLKASPGVTIFAPTDAAFAALPAGALEKLLEPQNAQDLRKMLLYMTVGEKVAPAELAAHKGAMKTQADAELTLASAGGRITADEATVTGDFAATNGTVFKIDKVIMPDGVDLGADADADAN